MDDGDVVECPACLGQTIRNACGVPYRCLLCDDSGTVDSETADDWYASELVDQGDDERKERG